MKPGKEIFRDILTKRHLPIIGETERGLLTRYQLSYIQVSCPTDETPCAVVLLNGLFTADDEREMRLALKTCNELNGNMIMTKFFIDSDNELSITAEFFYDEVTTAEKMLSIALLAIVAGKKRFSDLYESVEADDRIISELRNP